MEQKVILVTGASSGIGKETALTLARQGHAVIIHGRDVVKTQAVFKDISAATGNKDIDIVTADLSLMSEVKKFADQIKSKYDRLDVLINNAGGQFGTKREVTAEGHEKTLAINTLAPFLLTHLLLDILKNSPSARVVTVNSESYRMGGKPYLDDIELETHYSLTKSYGLSKLYALWIMQHYARELTKQNVSNVTVNSVEPGSADTDLGRVSAKGLAKIVYFLWKPMMWSIEKAAATSIYMATSDEVEGVTGKFYGDKKEKKVWAKYYSEENEQKIWDFCMEACQEYLN